MMTTAAVPLSSTLVKFQHAIPAYPPPPSHPHRCCPALSVFYYQCQCRCRMPATSTGVGTEQLPAPCPSPSPSCFYIRNGSRGDDDGISTSGLHGRRGLVLLSAFSLLSSPHYSAAFCDANAQGDGRIDADESSLVRTGVKKVLSKAKAAGVLRLVFHDAGTFDMNDNTGGMNGSIVLELDRPENAGLNKSVKVLQKAKNEVDKVHQVSWADLIAVAGAEAVSLCGGPVIPIRFGRMDARIPDPEGKLPGEKLDASELKKCFLEKGFSTQELVVLSGAHTLGGKGFGNPNVFDNTYYKVLLEKPWMSSDSMSKMIGLPSDHALIEDEECLRWVTTYAADQVKFFDDFTCAYIKLVNTGASWRQA